MKDSYSAMEALLHTDDHEELRKIKALKIPDFMSRLRVVIDIDGIDIPEELLRDSSSLGEGL